MSKWSALGMLSVLTLFSCRTAREPLDSGVSAEANDRKGDSVVLDGLVSEYERQDNKGIMDWSQIKDKARFLKITHYGEGKEEDYPNGLVGRTRVRQRYEVAKQQFSNTSIAPKQLAGFTTDGCSMFPDGPEDDPDLWRDCCTVHDISYWIGGTKGQRREADKTLASCVKQKIKDKAKAEDRHRTLDEVLLSRMMFIGVRMGGRARFFLPWRWGYGWNHRVDDRIPLTVDEIKEGREKLSGYLRRLEARDFAGDYGPPSDPDALKGEVEGALAQFDSFVQNPEQLARLVEKEEVACEDFGDSFEYFHCIAKQPSSKPSKSVGDRCLAHEDSIEYFNCLSSGG